MVPMISASFVPPSHETTCWWPAVSHEQSSSMCDTACFFTSNCCETKQLTAEVSGGGKGRNSRFLTGSILVVGLAMSLLFHLVCFLVLLGRSSSLMRVKRAIRARWNTPSPGGTMKPGPGVERAFAERQFRVALQLLRYCTFQGYAPICAIIGLGTGMRVYFMFAFYFLLGGTVLSKISWTSAQDMGVAQHMTRVLFVASPALESIGMFALEAAGVIPVPREVPTLMICWVGAVIRACFLFIMRLGMFPNAYRACYCTVSVIGFALRSELAHHQGCMDAMLIVTLTLTIGELIGWAVLRSQRHSFMLNCRMSEISEDEATGTNVPGNQQDSDDRQTRANDLSVPTEAPTKDQMVRIKEAFLVRQRRSSFFVFQRTIMGAIFLGVAVYATTGSPVLLIQATVISSVILPIMYKIRSSTADSPDILCQRLAILPIVACATRYGTLCILDGLRVFKPHPVAGTGTVSVLLMVMTFNMHIVMVERRCRALFLVVHVVGTALRPPTAFKLEHSTVLLTVFTALIVGEVVGGVVLHVLWTSFFWDQQAEHRLEVTPEQQALILNTCAEMSVADKLSLEQFFIRQESIRLEEKIGSGNFAEVIKATLLSIVWPGQETAVAVKVLHKNRVNKMSLKMMVEEVVMMTRVRHPNIITYIGYTFLPFVSIVFEYASCGTVLDLLLSNGGRTSVDKPLLLKLLMDICRGMAYLHEVGTVHNDLKGDNVFVTDDLTAKVGDLGLAHRPGSSQVSVVGGTVPWCAPERFEHSPWIDGKKCDVYSFAILVWELCSGGEETPYGGSDVRATTTTTTPPVSNSAIASRIATKKLQKDLERLGSGSLFFEVTGDSLYSTPEVPAGGEGVGDKSTTPPTCHRRSAKSIECDRFNARVAAIVRSNGRPQLDPTFPPAIVKLMERCWHHDPDMRPSFASLTTDLIPQLSKSISEVLLVYGTHGTLDCSKGGGVGDKGSPEAQAMINTTSAKVFCTERPSVEAWSSVSLSEKRPDDEEWRRRRVALFEEEDFDSGSSPVARAIAMAKKRLNQENKEKS